SRGLQEEQPDGRMAGEGGTGPQRVEHLGLDDPAGEQLALDEIDDRRSHPTNAGKEGWTRAGESWRRHPVNVRRLKARRAVDSSYPPGAPRSRRTRSTSRNSPSGPAASSTLSRVHPDRGPRSQPSRGAW